MNPRGPAGVGPRPRTHLHERPRTGLLMIATDDQNPPTPDAPTAVAPTPAPLSEGRRRAVIREMQDVVPINAVSRTHPGRLDKALELATLAARICDDNRGKDILLLDLRAGTPLIDFFVVASASSRRLANAIAIEIDVEMKKRGEKKLGMEGSEEGRWILTDYGDFVVHVFSEEARAYYSLEEIWGDAVQVDWRDPSRPTPKAIDADPEAAAG